MGRAKLAAPTLLADLETSRGEALRPGGEVVVVRSAEGTCLFSEPLPICGSFTASVW